MGSGSFSALASAVLLAGVTSAAAQNEAPIPPPPAPAALAVPNPLAAMTPGPRDLYRSPDGSDRFQHLAPYPAAPPAYFFPGPILAWPPFYSPYGPYESAVEFRPALDAFNRRSRAAAIGRGVLMLESIPDKAQIYIDDFYVGLAEDFGSPERAVPLAAGPHRIEVRAPGHEILAFNVMVQPNEAVRYRGKMQPATAAAAPRAAYPSADQRPVYVIPNCYAGDKPPTGTLPRGCDPKKLQTRK